MLHGGEHALVAVSGGADSMALLLSLLALSAEFGLSLTAAHLNHGIRGDEGDEDEAFVRMMSGRLGLPFVSESVELRKEASAAGRNLEELARERRYDFLARTAARIGAGKIAVGHTLNDQAETVLFRFLRGAGLQGLSAIHPIVNGTVIRPLLECSRESILDYLNVREISYREDSTNSDLHYARNRIRRELLPYIEKNLNPGISATLARESLMARESWAFMEDEARKAYERVHTRTAAGIALRVDKLLELHPALAKHTLRHALSESFGSLRGIAAVNLESLVDLCRSRKSGARVELPHRKLALRQFNELLLLDEAPIPGPSFHYELTIPGACHVREAGAVFRAFAASAPARPLDSPGKRAFLNPSLLPRTLVIRSREQGDRYGGPGRRRVKKMLIDRKIPLSSRSSLPMVVAGCDVIWIPGFSPASPYRAHPGAPECILIEVEEQGPLGDARSGR